MGSDYNKLIERMEEFERTHIRTTIPGRRELIKRLYEDFLFIYDDCTATMDERENEIIITLFIPNLTSCKEGGYCFNTLIYLAEITDMSIVDDCIVVKLWLYLWEWVEK